MTKHLKQTLVLIIIFHSDGTLYYNVAMGSHCKSSTWGPLTLANYIFKPEIVRIFFIFLPIKMGCGY